MPEHYTKEYEAGRLLTAVKEVVPSTFLYESRQLYNL